jgi:small subunit ribosomal protein S18
MATQRDDKKKRRRPDADAKKKRIVHTFKESDVVDYKDVSLLRKFMSDRGKIRSRRLTGLSPRRQKEVSMAIKNAREMALLPYTSTRT